MPRTINRTAFIVSCLLTLVLAVSCRKKTVETSNVKNIDCAASYLSDFVGGLPLPGFTLLGKIGSTIAGNVAGVLRGKVATQVKAPCGTPATFSDEQMQQMKQAIKEGFSEQNHMEAKALMNKIDTKLNEFVPDEERFSQYTLNNLQSIIDDVNDWWSKYDQSGTRIYNVQDFIIVTGLGLKSYQHQIREVALEANHTKSQGDAKKVRQYAQILSDKANHVRVELEEISNNDISAITKTFWKNEGKTQTTTYDALHVGNRHCYESVGGQSYNDYENPAEKGPKRTERFLSAIRSTKTLVELSDYVNKNGTVCCMDHLCAKNDIEDRLKIYMDETNKQVKTVMFYNDAAIMKYFNETLPLFIRVAGMIRDASDEDIYKLTENTEYKSDPQQGSNNTVSNSARVGCPDGDNGPGKGFGSIYQCGDQTCAKSDKNGVNECFVSGAGGSAPSSDVCPDGNNGPGKGFGTIYSCGDKKCAKSDMSFATQCTVRY